MPDPRLPRSLARALRRRRDPRGPQWVALAVIAVAILIASMPKARADDLCNTYNDRGTVTVRTGAIDD